MTRQGVIAPVEMANTAPTNVLVVGVGGQGVIMISKAVARLCQENGLEVKQSEVHGMAKRGGSVFSHIRFGQEVKSPLIPQGEADILLAMEWAEGLRWLPYLNPERGIFIADTQRIVPPFSCRDRNRGAESGYVNTSVQELVEKVPNAYAMDATSVATELGNARAANTVLLGALSTALEFSQEEWHRVIAEAVPPKTVGVNKEAFVKGRHWVESGETATDFSSDNVISLKEPRESRLEITQAWCKGCDICVKMCPERCLQLDQHQIVQLIDEKRCTGCRLCEWLCPDFAISVEAK